MKYDVKNSAVSSARKWLFTFLIVDMAILVALVCLYLFGMRADNQVVSYENAKLVFDDLSEMEVIPSGEPVGVYLKTDGVMVVDTSDVENQQGQMVCPCFNLIQTGDYITEINGESVENKNELASLLNDCNGENISVKFVRDNESMNVDVTPVQNRDGTYMLGLWVKDDISGIGTLTFIAGDRFMALGHSVSDNDTGKMVRSRSGGIYTTQITEINKSLVSMPGQLMGNILYKKDLIGIVEENLPCGIAGHLDTDYIAENYSDSEKMYIADNRDIKCGEAYIYSRLQGELKKYSIEITQVNHDSDSKNIEFTVIDEELIALTGGVVQGMSGSPIIMDDKIVGAVTHVFVNDPTKGYGIFIENMLEH